MSKFKKGQLAFALRCIDAEMYGRGFKLSKRQSRGSDVTVRLYESIEGDGGMSLAFTDDDLALPPLEFGEMLCNRIEKAEHNTF